MALILCNIYEKSIKCHSNQSKTRYLWHFQCNVGAHCVANCRDQIVRDFRLWAEIVSRARWTIGREKEQVLALPGLLPIYGRALNGPTRGQRHLSITNGTFALNVNAVWLNNCFLWTNKRPPIKGQAINVRDMRGEPKYTAAPSQCQILSRLALQKNSFLRMSIFVVANVAAHTG